MFAHDSSTSGANMLDDGATFSLDIRGVDRDRLIAEAAAEIDALGGVFGADDTPAATPEAQLARMLSEEIAELPHHPDVLEITEQDFAVSGREVPAAFAKRAEKSAIYWVRFPLALRPKHDWAFSRLELAVEFNPGGDEPAWRRPTALSILPNRDFTDRFKASANVDVSFDTAFELTAGIPEITIPTGAPVPVTAAAQASGKLGAGLGIATRYEWRLQKARIDHTETGLPRVFWRIDGTHFFAQDVPTPIVVLEVPRPVERLEVAAAMQAYRNVSLLNANLQETVKQLPKRLRDFFKGGSPLRDERSWDVAPSLAVRAT
jgi:hypothetical protein